MNDGQDIFMPVIIDQIRFYKKSYGHYANVLPFNDSAFKEQLKSLLKLTKYNGIFEAEFMKGPDGNNYFLEINFRASTWLYAITTCMKEGGGLPYYWAKSLLAECIQSDEINQEPFTAIVDFADFFNNVRIGEVGILKWVKQWLGSKCHYEYNKCDIMPYLSMSWHRRKQVAKTIIYGCYYSVFRRK